MAKKVFLIICLLMLAVIAGRNFIALRSIPVIVSSLTGASCTIDDVELGIRQIKVKGFSLKKAGANIFIERGTAFFSYDRVFPRPASLHCSGGIIEMENGKKTGFPAALQPEAGKAAARMFPVELRLSRFRVTWKNLLHGILSGTVSFAGRINEDRRLIVENIDLTGVDWIGREIQLKGLTMHKSTENFYSARIPSLTIGKKTIGEIHFHLEFYLKHIEIINSANPFFGPAGSIGGRIEKKNKDLVCIRVAGENLSFKNLLSLTDKNEDLIFEGLFRGDVTLCLQSGRPVFVSAGMRNDLGGTIEIKKETSLSFLRRYLDAATYSRIIDNLKNYDYNKGAISLSSSDSQLVAELYFESEEMGKRDFTIIFHNLLGGAQ